MEEQKQEFDKNENQKFNNAIINIYEGLVEISKYTFIAARSYEKNSNLSDDECIKIAIDNAKKISNECQKKAIEIVKEIIAEQTNENQKKED